MKISEIVEELRELQGRAGDMDVLVMRDESEWYSLVRVGFDKYEEDGPWYAELEIEGEPDFT